MILKNASKVMSVILASVFVFSSVSITSVGAQEESNNTNHAYNVAEELVDENLMKSNHNLTRLYSKETSLDTIIYSNSDGTETVYMFDEPVKYTDAAGNVVDKSNILYEVKDDPCNGGISAYANKFNNIRTYFPETLTTDNGVTLVANGETLEMTPNNSFQSKSSRRNNTVIYSNAFGNNTSLQYSPELNGFKEELVLDAYSGNQFSYTLETNGLIPVIDGQSVKLLTKTDEEFAVINPIFVYDSSDDPNITLNNKYELRYITDDKYELTTVIDDSFLLSETTIYPVVVDPTVTVYASGSGTAKTIIDTPIYNGSAVSGQTAGVNPTSVLGYVDSAYGSGRLLIRFPGLANQTFWNYNYTIVDASVTFREVSGLYDTSSIGVYEYTGESWNEYSTYSASRWNGYGTFQTSQSFSYPNQIVGTFNITNMAKIWQSSPERFNRGLMFKNLDSETNISKRKIFYTTEGSIKPYITVTYNTRTVESSALKPTGGNISRNVTLKMEGALTTSSEWLPILNNSRDAWNNSPAGTSISYTTSGSSPYTIKVESMPSEVTWLGQYSWATAPEGHASQSWITINATTLSDASNNARQSTVVHEMGHMLWLKDNPTTSDPTLMRYDRDRENTIRPQAFDVFHVLYHYS